MGKLEDLTIELEAIEIAIAGAYFRQEVGDLEKELIKKSAELKTEIRRLGDEEDDE